MAFFLGTLLVQAAWILAIPPYGAIDEFDHVYRADSVAHGYWRTWDKPVDGRGDLIPVRKSVIIDAEETCRSYDYVGRDNCRVVRDLGHGMGVVASAASRYHPLFYWLVGTPARAVDGAAAVYVMRCTAAVLCALVIGVIAWLTACWSRTSWPLLALVLGLTPVLVYATIVPAPNGIEILAGLGLWTCLAGLAMCPTTRARYLIPAVVFATVLTTVRSLGPLWLALVVFTSAVAWWPQIRARWRFTSSTIFAGIAMVAVATAASIWWVSSASTYEIEREVVEPLNPFVTALGQVPLWVFQSVAAAPIRNDPAPMPVYGLLLFSFTALLIAAAKQASVRMRLTLALAILLSLLVPYTFTVLTVERAGTIWQGRYALAFSIGIVVLCGVILDRSDLSVSRAKAWVGVSGIGLVSAQVMALVAVQLHERRWSPIASDDRWLQAPWIVTAAVVAMGTGIWVVASARCASQPSRAAGDRGQTLLVS